MAVRIMGTGSALPRKRVDNQRMEQLVETSDEWIRERTGIASRYVSTGETVAELGAEAALKALEDAGGEAGGGGASPCGDLLPGAGDSLGCLSGTGQNRCGKCGGNGFERGMCRFSVRPAYSVGIY